MTFLFDRIQQIEYDVDVYAYIGILLIGSFGTSPRRVGNFHLTARCLSSAYRPVAPISRELILHPGIL